MRLPKLSNRQQQQLWYLPILGLALALLFARIVVLARLLPVDQFADYATGLLISSTFCMLNCIGLQTALQRSMPVDLLRGRHRAAQTKLAQAILVASALFAIGVFCVLIVGDFLGHSTPQTTIAGLTHGYSQQIFLLATVPSRSGGNTILYAKENLARAVMLTLSGLAGANAGWGGASVIWIEASIGIVASGLTLHLATRSRHFRSSIRPPAVVAIAWRTIGKTDWSATLALTFVSILGFLLANVDRWIAKEFLRTDDFAIYAFVGIAATVGQSAQSMVNAAAFPMIARRHASLGPAAAFMFARQLSLAFLGIALVLAALCFLPIIGIVDHWFSAYSGQHALWFFVLLASVFRVSDYWTSFLVVAGHERRAVAVDLCVLGALLPCWTIALSDAFPLDLNAVGLLALGLSLAHWLGSMASAMHVRSNAVRH